MLAFFYLKKKTHYFFMLIQIYSVSHVGLSEKRDNAASYIILTLSLSKIVLKIFKSKNGEIKDCFCLGCSCSKGGVHTQKLCTLVLCNTHV